MKTIKKEITVFVHPKILEIPKTKTINHPFYGAKVIGNSSAIFFERRNSEQLRATLVIEVEDKQVTVSEQKLRELLSKLTNSEELLSELLNG